MVNLAVITPVLGPWCITLTAVASLESAANVTKLLAYTPRNPSRHTTPRTARALIKLSDIAAKTAVLAPLLVFDADAAPLLAIDSTSTRAWSLGEVDRDLRKISYRDHR